MFTQPLCRWRQATALDQRTKTEWAQEVAAILDGRHADCAQITLVRDSLNTHTEGAFYEVYPPEKARAYVRNIHFCCTPKHGSWVNVAENELSSMARQCLKNRRMPSLKKLKAEIKAWFNDVNETKLGVDRQMKNDDARCKLKNVHPKIKL